MRIERALKIVQGMERKSRRLPHTARLHSCQIPQRVDYLPVPKPWSWATGTPKERADFVRRTARIEALTSEYLCDLFDLTMIGLADILRGRDWKPTHCPATAQPAPAVRE